MHRFLILFSLFPQTVFAAVFFGVGQRDFVYQDTKRGRSLSTHVWYPVDAKTAPTPNLEKDNPFLPVISAKNAPLPALPTKLPVVLLSHGSGGKADKLFWLVEQLVKAGSVVLAVDHPGNMTGDNSADGMMRVWERPADLTFAFDRLLEEPNFKDRLETHKVAAAGHSAGGTTVLLLAGARLAAGRLTSPIPECSGTKDPYYAQLCKGMKSLNLSKYSRQAIEADYTDPRVKAVVALDPGFSRSFQPESYKGLKAKPLFFIADKLNTPYDQIHSKEFVRAFPFSVEVISNSYHMSFLQACRPGFAKDDPELSELCVDNDRKLDIQKRVAGATVDFFNNTWSKLPVAVN